MTCWCTVKLLVGAGILRQNAASSDVTVPLIRPWTCPTCGRAKLHLYAWLLLLLSAATTVPPLWTRLGGSAAAAGALDATLSLALLAALAVYLYASIGPVYGGSRVRRAVSAAALTLAAAAIVLGYRFALLVITPATT
jgi:hypothetical protein